jgi:hypothetical protein
MGWQKPGKQMVAAMGPSVTDDEVERAMVALEGTPDTDSDRAIDHDPVATAWSIHTSIAEWTRSVDNKASFASAVETGVLFAVLTLLSEGRQLSRLSGFWQVGVLWLGIAVLVAALLLVLWVISPHLRSKRVGNEHRSNAIYFGHARYWNPEELTTFLSGADILPMLSRQIVAISHIAWRKHRHLQFSIFASVVGASLVAIAAGMSALAS